MPESPILTGLNDAQRRAVAAGTGPYLILAGPGSGKTRVLTHRIAYLSEEMGVPAYRIMAVTFTNKAAREMQHRAQLLLSRSESPAAHSGLLIGTFHSICARFLRIEHAHTPYTQDYLIYDTRDQLAAVKKAALDAGVDIKRFTPRSLLNAISDQKNELRTPEVYADRVDTYFDEIASRVYARYQVILRDSNAMDFDDLLMQTVILFQRYPEVAEKYQTRLEHVLVDEFQDTNFAQYKLVQALAAPQNNLFAVGDPDQSIYAFRGADYRNVLRFERDYPDHTKVLLEQNYRSTQHILDAAMAIIDRNPNRTPKRLFTDRGAGEKIGLYEAYDENDEAGHIVETIVTLNERAEFNPGECAVMYRTNAQSRALEGAFQRAGIPYRLVGATAFYERAEIKDLLAYLRLILNPNDVISLERIINTPARGIGTKTVETLTEWAVSLGVSPGVALLSLLTGAEAPFTPRARKQLESFAGSLAAWQTLAVQKKTPLEILDAVIDDIGYASYLNTGGREDVDRWENVMELRAGAAEFEGQDLATYLTEVSLVSDVDTRDDDVDAPSLMTLHSAKGLEFPVVFICGIAEGTLPHMRSLEAELAGDAEALPEERRLMYVGLTRAKDRLYLSYAFRGSRFGDYEPNLPSRFLSDLPRGALAGQSSETVSQAYQGSYRRMTAWADDLPTVTGRSREGGSSGGGRGGAVPAQRFRPGMGVIHPVFGEGVVISSRVYSDSEEVEVQFTTSGRKRIDGNFLEPSGQ